MDSEKQIYSVREAAVIAGRHYNTIMADISSGKLKAHKADSAGRFNSKGHGIPWIINAADLADYLVSRGNK